MNSLQAGLIGVSVLVIALFAAWMWWQSWRGSRAASRVAAPRPDHDAASAPPIQVATQPSAHDRIHTPTVASDASIEALAGIEERNEPRLSGGEAELQSLYPAVGQRAESVPPSPVMAQSSVAVASPNVSNVVNDPPPSPHVAASLAPKTVAPVTTLPVDERLNVFAVITARDGQAVDCDEFAAVADRTLAWGRVFRVSAWELIEEIASGGAVQSLCLALPIASRAGPLTDRDAIEWKRSIASVCDRRGFDVTFGGDIGVGERAQELDQFLAAADVICVLYLVRKDSGAWSGTRLRGTLEANGFRLQADGRFVYFEVESETPIFSAVDGFERSFSPERLRTENVTALRLVFEASNVANPVARFDVYRQTLRALARLLEAEIKDSSGAVVGDAEFVELRNDVVAGSAALSEAGIECGSIAAQSLFR